MLHRARIDKANLSLVADGEGEYFTLRLDCSPEDERSVLEIGEEYIFTAKANRLLTRGRKSCDFRAWVKRRSSASPQTVEKLNLSASKIGELGFYPSYEKGDFPARPAALEAVVFVSDDLFDKLLMKLQATTRAAQLELEIEKKGVLEYGWEPDGSRHAWKLEKTNDPSYVNVERIEIGIDLLG